MTAHILTCRCCGLAQRAPEIPERMRACCARCGPTLRKSTAMARSNGRTAAIALAALILYPLAVSLPVLKVQQMGHHTESSILEGIITLLADGQIVVGLVVLMCS